MGINLSSILYRAEVNAPNRVLSATPASSKFATVKRPFAPARTNTSEVTPTAPSIASAGVTTTAEAAADDAATQTTRRRAWLVPRVLFASNLMLGLASGMTIKFFPLFFKNECLMSPVGVQAIYTGVPLLLAFFARLATCLAKRFGRVQTMIGLKVVGVGLLVAMALLVPWVKRAPGGGDEDDEGEVEGGGGGVSRPARVGVMVAIYLVRTAVMNCAAAG